MKVRIDGMMCPKCAARVQKALDAIGVKAEIDLENKCALIPDGADADAVKEAVNAAGYTFVSAENV